MTDLTPEYVKAALDGATPGPWIYSGRAICIENPPTTIGIISRVFDREVDATDNNAILIAMAPDLAREYLRLKEVEKAGKVPVGAIDALAGYQQADADGVMVLVSRQAIDECLPALRALAGHEVE